MRQVLLLYLYKTYTSVADKKATTTTDFPFFTGQNQNRHDRY